MFPKLYETPAFSAFWITLLSPSPVACRYNITETCTANHKGNLKASRLGRQVQFLTSKKALHSEALLLAAIWAMICAFHSISHILSPTTLSLRWNTYAPSPLIGLQASNLLLWVVTDATRERICIKILLQPGWFSYLSNIWCSQPIRMQILNLRRKFFPRYVTHIQLVKQFHKILSEMKIMTC